MHLIYSDPKFRPRRRSGDFTPTPIFRLNPQSRRYARFQVKIELAPKFQTQPISTPAVPASHQG